MKLIWNNMESWLVQLSEVPLDYLQSRAFALPCSVSIALVQRNGSRKVHACPTEPSSCTVHALEPSSTLMTVLIIFLHFCSALASFRLLSQLPALKVWRWHAFYYMLSFKIPQCTEHSVWESFRIWNLYEPLYQHLEWLRPCKCYRNNTCSSPF